MAKKAGQCDDQTNRDNETIANARSPIQRFGKISGVTIIATDAAHGTVDFDAPVAQGGRHTYRDVPWANEAVMWVCCPTSLPSGCSDPNDSHNGSLMPAVNATGNLFVNQSWARTQQPIPQLNYAPKWPSGAEDRNLYREITLLPRSLTLTAAHPSAPEDTVDLELLMVATAEPEQTIHINPNGIKVRVTQAAFAAFGQAFPNDEKFGQTVKAAVATLIAGDGDAPALCQALSVISTAVASLREAKLSGEPNAALVSLVQQVLPAFVP